MQQPWVRCGVLEEDLHEDPAVEAGGRLPVQALLGEGGLVLLHYHPVVDHGDTRRIRPRKEASRRSGPGGQQHVRRDDNREVLAGDACIRDLHAVGVGVSHAVAKLLDGRDDADERFTAGRIDGCLVDLVELRVEGCLRPKENREGLQPRFLDVGPRENQDAARMARQDEGERGRLHAPDAVLLLSFDENLEEDLHGVGAIDRVRHSLPSAEAENAQARRDVRRRWYRARLVLCRRAAYHGVLAGDPRNDRHGDRGCMCGSEGDLAQWVQDHQDACYMTVLIRLVATSQAGAVANLEVARGDDTAEVEDRQRGGRFERLRRQERAEEPVGFRGGGAIGAGVDHLDEVRCLQAPAGNLQPADSAPSAEEGLLWICPADVEESDQLLVVAQRGGLANVAYRDAEADVEQAEHLHRIDIVDDLPGARACLRRVRVAREVLPDPVA
mmetsp:Transcript_72823/g.189063  ORF Transcript_72823/g.189063 Transcript_72823/m.189063 type:complete len:442 (-) Transcript_72823:2062-3387(-)